jgi:hypothetical protein
VSCEQRDEVHWFGPSGHPMLTQTICPVDTRCAWCKAVIRQAQEGFSIATVGLRVERQYFHYNCFFTSLGIDSLREGR